MKINRIRYLKGPNYFSFKPTMWVELDIEELEFQPSDHLKGFNEVLLKLIPTLSKHTCSLGYEGGFVERLYEGTWMGHILEHVTLELQSLAGIEVRRGKTLTSEKKGIYFVTFDYKEPKSGLKAFHSAIEIVERILKGDVPSGIQSYINEIAELFYENKLGPSTEAIYDAAFEAEIPVERVGRDSFLRLGTGSKQKFVQATITSQTSYLAVENACDKQMTKTILASAGVPVPKGEVASTFPGIFDAADRLGFPLVIKPLNGRQGQGVITNIRNKEELFNVVNCMDSKVDEFIIERFYEGDDYRLIVVNGELVGASLRLPPFVIGNGEDTIRKLIERENENPLRGEGHEKPMTKIPLQNYAVSCYLEKWDLSMSSVPEKGKVVQVVGNANLSTGGQAIDVTDQVHPSLKNMAITAAEAIGLDVAGVDLICKDISKPANCNEIAIVEVNAAPGIRMHHYPSKGKKRDVGKAIVDYLFPNPDDAQIPIVSITGTNGKTTTTRLVKHFLEKDDFTVGMTNSDGVWIGSQCIDEGDCSGPISARKVLSNPKVDAAVLETARGGILREGLAFRFCDVGIVTNVSEDHLGLDGIETFDQLVKLKRLVPEVVKENGYCVLNADDPEVVRMAEYTDGTVIFTSLYHDNEHILQSVAEGKIVWFLGEDQWIYCGKTRFLPEKDIPVTIEGAARYNISNLLQALAAAHALGVSFEVLKDKALSFKPDFEQSKGRFNKVSVKGRDIIVDYAHNPAGLKAFFDTAKQFIPKRMITVISAPGDRRNPEIKEMGAITATHSDSMIIKEDKDLRGRKPLETAKLLQEAALEEKFLNISIIPDEHEAYTVAWKQSEIGDALVFLYEDFSVVTNFIREIEAEQNQIMKEIV
ncbi:MULTISPECIES: cyanophycin synthetase [unclassified Bacillus (in: firmicutes)]|uniref:cyanophycin synthetase n=1 Tax=unclassified Bacillus (in: firmicutes) TaxID=185979 RepID=UPI0008E78D18|nr:MULTISPECIES: cyanophycin synthetase [unclassified Bacillus (in: firmicutes)]SFB20694.1 cyanophycin synthetase [Bacillus sp. UNCCL13]SFQ90894.1 cyanophycin synthetase [Bacillus sp. cl95]